MSNAAADRQEILTAIAPFARLAEYVVRARNTLPMASVSVADCERIAALHKRLTSAQSAPNQSGEKT